MKLIKETRLRKYIRRILLTEGMKQASDLPEDAYVWIMDNGNILSVRVDAPSWPTHAYLTLRKAPHGCSGAWEVVSATAPHGWGPLAYDIAMEYVGGEGIMSDRSSVSSDAAAVWDFYLKNRPDVKAIQLDSKDSPFLTPDDKTDDCPENTFLTHNQEVMRNQGQYWFDPSEFPGQEELWKDHWSTKKYVKMGGSPTIDKLNDMNILEYKYQIV